jgi:hypothetical protein
VVHHPRWGPRHGTANGWLLLLLLLPLHQRKHVIDTGGGKRLVDNGGQKLPESVGRHSRRRDSSLFLQRSDAVN